MTKIEQIYVKGKIVEHVWGYDQTNVDYFLITKRTAKFVTLQPIGRKNVHATGFMSGKCVPDPSRILDKPAIRRKVYIRDGRETGVAIFKSHGWASLWDGKPSHWSNDR